MNNQPTLSPLTKQYLVAIFEPELRDEAVDYLINDCGYAQDISSTEKGIERIRCAALKKSRGSIEELVNAIALAQLDWRDLLVTAGFSNPEDHLTWKP
ncbi:MAG: hypothetical protein GKR98_04280 [Boseongicola sp.]|nr:MAG: hypothetical protein GKR98_04280 [Boseongicola sp.]